MKLQYTFTAKWGDRTWRLEYKAGDWEIDGNDRTNQAIAKWRAKHPSVDVAEFTLEIAEASKTAYMNMHWDRKNDESCAWSA